MNKTDTQEIIIIQHSKCYNKNAMWEKEISNIGTLNYFNEFLSYILQNLEYHI